MTKQIIIVSFIMAMTLVVSPIDASNSLQAQGKRTNLKPSRKPIISRIKDDKVLDGCGCYFSYPPEDRWRFPRYVFSSDFHEENAWMNIDGQDIKLKLRQSTRPKGKEKIGSRLTRTYVASGIKVSVLYITTRLCQPGDENCESIDYNATITVTKGGRKQTVKLKGGCGC